MGNDNTIEDNSELFLDENTADVKLIIKSEKIHAHKYVLSLSSEYFSAMFGIGMIETELDEINIEETDHNLFKFVLKNAYGIEISETEWKQKSLADIFDSIVMSSKYRFVEVERLLSHMLLNQLKRVAKHHYVDGQTISSEQSVAYEVYDMSKDYHLYYLCDLCRDYIEKLKMDEMKAAFNTKWGFIHDYWYNSVYSW